MRALLPLFALAGIIALPATLAQTPAEKPTAADASTKQRSIEPRETAIVRLKAADVRVLAKSLSEILSMEPTPSCGSFKVIADPETNTLVMTGSADALAKARNIIKELDRAEAKPRQTETIRLKNARAKDMADLLRQIASQQLPSESQPGITMDDRTATLVITAEPAALATLKAMAATFDVADVRPQYSDATPTQARVTVYQIDVPLNQSGSLSSTALTTNTHDEASFMKELSKYGRTQHLHTLDQSIDLAARPTLAIDSMIPIADSTIAKDGAATPQIGYHSVGCKVEFEALRLSPTPASSVAAIRVEISALRDSGIELSPTTRAPITQKIKQTFNGPWTSGTPIVLVSLESSPAKETATAYITRIELTKPAVRG